MDRQSIRDNVRLTSLIEDTNVTDTQINTLIAQALSEISVAYTWNFLQANTTITLVAAQNNYALPNDFIYGVALVDDDNDERIAYISPTTYFDIVGNDTGNTGTTADFFTIWNDEILITPIPSAADTDRYSLYYYRDITALSLDTDSPEFHVAFHWMVVEWCKWKLYDREEYYDQAERAFITYSRYLADMIDWYSNRMKLEPFAWGDGRFGRFDDPNIPGLAKP